MTRIARACGLGGGDRTCKRPTGGPFGLGWQNRLRHRPSCKVGEDEKNQQSGEASGLAKPPLVALQAVVPVGRLSAWLRGGLRDFARAERRTSLARYDCFVLNFRSHGLHASGPVVARGSWTLIGKPDEASILLRRPHVEDQTRSLCTRGRPPCGLAFWPGAFARALAAWFLSAGSTWRKTGVLD